MVKSLRLKRRRDIARQRGQFLSVLATIVLGVMMFAATYDAYRNLEASYNGTYRRLAFADVTVTGGTSGLNDALAAIDGVASVERRRQADVPLRVGDTVLLGRIVSLTNDVNLLDVVAGEHPGGGSAAGIVETHLAEHFGLRQGDTVEVLTNSGWSAVAVSGEAVSAEYLWPARSSQEFFEAPGSFGVLFVTDDVLDSIDETQILPQLLVLYHPDADTVTLDDAVRSTALKDGAEAVVTRADQPSNKALNLDVTGFEQMAVFFPAMFLLVSGLAAYTLLTRVVHSQRSVIGTLRANGFSRGTVLWHYLSYGLWLGTLGAVLGIALGIPAGWAMTAAYTAELGIPDTIRELRWITPIGGITFGVAVGLLSAWVPARAAVRLEPAEALRGDSPASSTRRSLLDRVFPPSSGLPVQWLMVVRGIGRNPRRSSSVVVAIVLAMTLVYTTWAMVDTVTILLDRHFSEINRHDGDVVTSVPVDDAVVEAVAGVPGVRTAEPVVVLEASLQGPDDTYSTTLFAHVSGTEVHGFVTPSGRGPTTGVVVGEAVLGETGAEVGGMLRVSLPTLGVTFDATIEDTVREPMGSPVYLTREMLEEVLGTDGGRGWREAMTRPGTSVIALMLDDDADRDAALDEVRDLPAVAAVTDVRAVWMMIEQYLGLFYLIVGLMLAFGGVLAVALIYNVVSVNLAERTGELATMRANGVSHRRIGAYVMAENMILTAFGVIPGGVVAHAAASWLMSTYSTDMLSFELEARPATMALTILAMLLVTAVLLRPGIRAVRRLDVATAVRERSQ